MRKILFSLFVFLLILGLPLISGKTSCKELLDLPEGANCYKCLQIDIDIKPTEGSKDYFVGDYFYYEIDLTNLGEETINSNFHVRILSPNGENVEGSDRAFSDKTIEKNSSILLKPESSVGPGVKVSVYSFDMSGPYRLEISSSDNVQFYRFYYFENGRCKNFVRYSQNYTYIVDVMPSWQKNFQDFLYDATEETKDMTEGAAKIAQTTKNYTWIILVATIIMMVTASLALIFQLTRFEYGAIQFVLAFVLLLILPILFGIYGIIFPLLLWILLRISRLGLTKAQIMQISFLSLLLTSPVLYFYGVYTSYPYSISSPTPCESYIMYSEACSNVRGSWCDYLMQLPLYSLVFWLVVLIYFFAYKEVIKRYLDPNRGAYLEDPFVGSQKSQRIKIWIISFILSVTVSYLIHTAALILPWGCGYLSPLFA